MENYSIFTESITVFEKLFSKNGELSSPRQFLLSGYKWNLSLSFSEMHNVPAIDLKLRCDEIENGKFMSMWIKIQCLTNSNTYNFFQTFDKHRNSFCYRRIVTAVRHRRNGGRIVASFPINRFLVDEETGEHYDSPTQTQWPFYNAVDWDAMDDGRVNTKPCKSCYHRFEYSMTLAHITTFDALPDRHVLLKWPKSSGYPLHLEYFEPVWPNVLKALREMSKNQASSDDYWKMCDILGAYYHEWSFNEEKLQELNAEAIRLGFHEFMDGIGTGGHFLKMIQSRQTANIVRKCKNSDFQEVHEYPEKIQMYQGNWNVVRIPKYSECPSIFKIFLENDLQWNVTFFQSEYRDSVYLSVGAVLVGSLEQITDYDCNWTVTIRSNNSTFGIMRTAGRVLNRVQNSLCIPVFCLMTELAPFRCYQGHLRVQVKLEIRRIRETRLMNRAQVEMPGHNDAVLKLDDHCIAVNRDFLAHHVKFLSAIFFNENFDEHKQEQIEIRTVNLKTMLSFLDALYHGTKLFDVSEYYHVLRIADEWICEKVIRLVEKAIRNTTCETVNKEKLAKKFYMKLLLESSQNVERRKRELTGSTNNNSSMNAEAAEKSINKKMRVK